MPYELRPYPAPTLRAEGSYLQNAWRTSVYPMAARMGVDIKLPTVSPQPYTRLAFEGLEFAKENGRAEAYNSAVMRGFFRFAELPIEPGVRISEPLALMSPLPSRQSRRQHFAERR